MENVSILQTFSQPLLLIFFLSRSYRASDSHSDASSPRFLSAGRSPFLLRAFLLPFYRVVLLNPVLIAHPCTLTTSHRPEGETGEMMSQLYPALASTSFIHKGLSTTDQLKVTSFSISRRLHRSHSRHRFIE